MINQHPIISAQAGNAAVEYSLVGGLVLVASLGILFVLSGSLNVAVGKVKTDLNQKSTYASMVNAHTQAALANRNLMGNGLAIEIADYDASLAEAVQTSGGSGSTLAAATQLAALAKTLKWLGALDEDQAKNLKDLADQAVRMARMQELIESSYNAAGKDWSLVDQTIVKFEGQDYYVGELAQKLGWVSNSSGADLPFKLNPTGGEAVDFFRYLRAQVEANGCLDHPQIRALVDESFTQVVFISGMVEEGYDTREPDKEELAVEEQVEDTYEEIAENGETEMEEEAAALCATSGGTFVGGECKI